MKTEYVPFAEGLDLFNTPLAVKPGALLYASNYECPLSGGYETILGYSKIGGTLPGEGDVLGVAVLGTKYVAIRADVGSAAATLYTSTGGAWSAVAGALPVGRYDFVVHNFGGAASTRMLYMVCDQGKPWYFDGTTLTQITAAASGARWIAVHAQHLILGFEVGSVQFATPGAPTDWVTDSGELGVGDTINGLANAPGGVLMIGCQNSVYGLYGSTSTDFDVKTISQTGGIKANSLITAGIPYFAGEQGLTNLQVTQDFGDFKVPNWGVVVDRFFRNGFTPYACGVNKSKSQYRVFDSSGFGIWATVVGGKKIGVTTVQYGHNVRAVGGGDLDSGVEANLFGDDAGNVYLMDDGDDFAGGAILSALTTAFAHFKSPILRKRWRRVWFDIDPGDGTTFDILPSFDGGSEEWARHLAATLTAPATGGLWGDAKWDEFAWSGPLYARENIPISGTSTTLAFTISSTRTGTSGHKLNGYTVLFDPRRLRRD